MGWRQHSEPVPEPDDQTVRELDEDEIEYVRSNLGWLMDAGWDGQVETLGQLHDELLPGCEPGSDQEGPLISALGIGLGALVHRELDLRWMVLSDAQGADLVVRGGPHDVTLFPIATVARKRQLGETGWIPEWVHQVVTRVRQIETDPDSPLS